MLKCRLGPQIPRSLFSIRHEVRYHKHRVDFGRVGATKHEPLVAFLFGQTTFMIRTGFPKTSPGCNELFRPWPVLDTPSHSISHFLELVNASGHGRMKTRKAQETS